MPPTDREIMQQALDALNHVNVQDRVQIITALRERLAQPEQEPVACKTLCELCIKRGYIFCANAAQTTPIPSPPASKPWVGLTQEEMYEVGEFKNTHGYVPTGFKRLYAAIEAKLREKNNG